MTALQVSDPAAIADIMSGGGIVAIPTDTVFGLACDPGSTSAVERVYAMKQRPANLELVLLAADGNDLAPFIVMPESARLLAEHWWPGPLTLVVPIGEHRLAIPRFGTTLAVRVPGHDVCQALLRQSGPLATTSANRHGQPPCQSLDEIVATLAGDIDAVLVGQSGGGAPSTIIDCTTTPPTTIRKGPVTL